MCLQGFLIWNWNQRPSGQNDKVMMDLVMMNFQGQQWPCFRSSMVWNINKKNCTLLLAVFKTANVSGPVFGRVPEANGAETVELKTASRLSLFLFFCYSAPSILKKKVIGGLNHFASWPLLPTYMLQTHVRLCALRNLRKMLHQWDREEVSEKRGQANSARLREEV